ncbi:MAG: ABC transporter ATP-binding protein [Deltaproteobacteria bacterium]|nr:ABC transporter ATP-binding protein [Deltaproteobacteria bacterium]
MKELKIALRLLFGTKGTRALVWIALFATLCTALMPTLPPFLMKRTIDDGVLKNDPDTLLFFAGLFVAAVIVELIFSLASQTSLALLGQKAMHDLRGRLFAHLQSLDLGYFEREPRGRVLTRLTSDVEALSEMFTSGAVTMFADFVVALGIVFAMLLLDAKLTAIVFLTVPPLIVLSEIFRRKARDAFRDIRARVARLNGFAAEHLAGAEVIQAFRQHASAEKRFDAINEELQVSQRSAISVDATLFAVVEAIGSTAVAAMIWFAARDLISGALQLGVLVAFIQYVQRFFIPIRDLSAKFAIIQSGFAAAERVDQFLAVKPALSVPAAPRTQAKMLPVRFERVGFAYSGGKPVLNDVSLTIEPGKKIALVGATGAGKTTFVKLLLRLVDASDGRIVANDLPIGEWDLAAMRRRVAIVPQDPVIFAGTVRDNLREFDPAISDDAIWAAARAIGTDKLILRLPLGLDHPLKERGTNLSSGEAQLIAFTRALIREPELLVLDEATSSIDATNEAAITRGLSVLLENRAALVIAHRLATLRMCDEIIVIEHGKIAERGTHDGLVERGGLYAALYELQFQKSA